MWTEKDVKITLRKDRGVYYVVVPGTVGWKSSGCDDYRQAIDWALRTAGAGFSADVTLREYTKDFFIPGDCPRIKLLSGRNNSADYWADLRFFLEAYLWPRWGSTILPAIRPKAWFSWVADPGLLRASPAGSGGIQGPLSSSARNKLQVCLNHVLDQAVFDELIQANPMRGTVPWVPDDSREPDTFADDELAKMFPVDWSALASNWDSLRWAALYMVLSDTGLRPSEALALRWRDWHLSDRMFVVGRRVGRRGDMGPLKTSKKAGGVKIKPAAVGPWTAAVLLVEDLTTSPDPDDLIFPATKSARLKNHPMQVTSADGHFQLCLDKMGIPRVRREGGKPRTQYCLRHTANTAMVTLLGDEAARLMMGHVTTQMTQRYDHPEVADVLARGRKALGR